MLTGDQMPRLLVRPENIVSSAGEETIDLCNQIGFDLDPWQRLCVMEMLAENDYGKWAALEAGLVVPRQNGKGSVLEARELAALFLFGDRLILHSAHEFKTAQEAFLRIKFWIDNTDWLRKRVKKIREAHGEEGIEFINGQRLRFIARSRSSGRGFTGDLNVLDEAYNLPDKTYAALLPTMSARPNPQAILTSSSGDEDSIVLGRLRARALKTLRGETREPRLSYLEWSVPEEAYEAAREAGPAALREYAGDRRNWATANPGLGIRLTEEFTEVEFKSMSAEQFAKERLGVGMWPLDDMAEAALPVDKWNAAFRDDSRLADPVAIGFDITPQRTSGAIGAAGRNQYGEYHVELIQAKSGTAWIVPTLVELVAKWEPVSVALDPASPAASLIDDLEAAGIEVELIGGRDLPAACGLMHDGVRDGVIRHANQPNLSAAVLASRKVLSGDTWKFGRKVSTGDISPLYAVTLALKGFVGKGDEEYDVMDSVY